VRYVGCRQRRLKLKKLSDKMHSVTLHSYSPLTQPLPLSKQLIPSESTPYQPVAPTTQHPRNNYLIPSRHASDISLSLSLSLTHTHP
jgi:hypothetical protein